MKMIIYYCLAGLVFFAVNDRIATAEDDISATARSIEGIDDIHPLTDEECKKITGGPIIPPDTEKLVIKVIDKEKGVLLPRGNFWIFGGEKRFQTQRFLKPAIMYFPEGVYVIYMEPAEKTSPIMEAIKKRSLERN